MALDGRREVRARHPGDRRLARGVDVDHEDAVGLVERSRELLEQRVEKAYLDRFFDGGRLQRTGADASVTYLYLPEQLEPVLELWPDSRFVVAVRNPLEMLPSLHRRLIYLGDEVGTLNDYGYAADPALAGDSRWVHRPATDGGRHELRDDPETLDGRIFAGLTRLRWHEIAWKHHGACRHHQGLRREARSQRMATQAA